jgi:hypothetical protein
VSTYASTNAVACTGRGSCAQKVQCAGATCTINCSGQGSCGAGTTCNAGSCL